MKRRVKRCGALLWLFPVWAGAQVQEVNVAALKPTFGDVAFGAPTSRGNDKIDGSRNAGNWTHADYPTSAVPYPGETELAPNPYWQVDLEGTFDLTRLELVDRVGCCDPNRLNGSTISLLDDTGAVIGDAITVDGLPASSTPETATLEFDNEGAGWTGVSAIRIDGLVTNQYFQFSEFRAFSLQTVITNVALGAPVTTSAPTFGTQGAAKLTDGALNNQTHPAEGSTLGFTYSIDLGRDFELEEIVLYNRADGCCPDRLTNYRVSLHLDDGAGLPGEVVWTADVRTDGSNSGQSGEDRLTPDLDPDGSLTGRHLVIENLSDDPYNPQIAEVEALTSEFIPAGPENLAFGTAAQYFDAAGTQVAAWNGLPASNVTDGLAVTLSHPRDQLSADYYLQINLGRTVTVGSVAVTGRQDTCCPDRLEDARLELLDEDLNVVFTQIMAGQVVETQEFAVPGSLDARYVRIINANGAGYGPQVGEVQVFAPGGSGGLLVALQSADPVTGAMTLSFDSVPGLTYAIFASDSLESGSWAEVMDNVQPQGDRTTVNFTDFLGVGSTRRFYRVERE